MKKTVLVFLAAILLAALPALSQTEQKIRVLAAPGVNQADPKDWHNTLAISADTLTVTCPKCSPTQSIAVQKSNVAALRYGQNAYHHWVSGIVTGVFSLGIGTIIGAMPHHQHYFSIDTKDGKALGIQADKSNYRQIAGMLENFASLPIQVTAKDAHFLSGFNTKIVAATEK